MIYPGCLYKGDYFISFGLYELPDQRTLVEIMYNYDSTRVDWTQYTHTVTVVAT